jgi:hypothetical protein
MKSTGGNDGINSHTAILNLRIREDYLKTGGNRKECRPFNRIYSLKSDWADGLQQTFILLLINEERCLL